MIVLLTVAGVIFYVVIGIVVSRIMLTVSSVDADENTGTMITFCWPFMLLLLTAVGIFTGIKYLSTPPGRR